LQAIGGDFTWNNKAAGPNFTQSKLDRAFTDLRWIDIWPQARVEFYKGSTSDHATMIITFSSIEKGGKPFRLYDS